MNQAEFVREGRYILGGAWTQAPYVFIQGAAAPAFDRSAINGFRCARDIAPLPDRLLGPMGKPVRDYSQEKPVSDEIFQVFCRFFSYDRTDLNATVDSLDDRQPYWRKETVTFDAAYGNERVIAHLFLPKNAVPPYQTVVYVPGSGSEVARSSDDLEIMVIDFLIRSGRAVLYPVYKGTYERHVSPVRGAGNGSQRDRVVSWYKDLGRSLDYLETRPDIDRRKLAYFGFSDPFGPIMLAVDRRLTVGILLASGFLTMKTPPEVDPLHFAARATQPTLLLSGRYDYNMPLEECQMPLLRMLGAPAKDKRIVLFETGHVVYPTPAMVKESLAWLNRYLGPVRTK